MGTNKCSQSASKSWYSQDFGDVSMVLKWSIFASPPGHNELNIIQKWNSSNPFQCIKATSNKINMVHNKKAQIGPLAKSDLWSTSIINYNIVLGVILRVGSAN